MPVMCTCGVPNVFNFLFRAGSSLADCTIDGKSSSTGNNKNSNARTDVRAIASPPSQNTGNTDSSPCGALSKVPRELRDMIYMNVLIVDEAIARPHRFLGRQPSILVEDGKYIQTIDAALLRTCKAIYHEAVRILYGRNCFWFFKPSDIQDFAHLGLGNVPFGLYGGIGKSASAANNAPYGRLTLIRRLYLRLGPEYYGDHLRKVWWFWSDFFYPPEKQDHLVRFPALERLALDLRDWRLDAGYASKIRIQPFLQKLRPKRGLKHLTLLGVGDEQDLRDFKHGFVRQGGTFCPVSRSPISIADTVVSHDDLPDVSMCVRAIVERGRASRAVSRRKNAGTSDSK